MKLGGYKYEILAQNKYKSTKSTNPTVLQIPAPKKWKNSDKQSHNIVNIGQNVGLNKSEE